MPRDVATRRSTFPWNASWTCSNHRWTRCARCSSTSRRSSEERRMVRDVLRMGDPRLWQRSATVERFDTPELHALLQDMRDTMHAVNGAGLAAPQLGVQHQVVIFG